MREYVAARDRLRHFGVESIMLMTNNLRRTVCLQQLDGLVAGTNSCTVKPRSYQMKKYMHDKAQFMDHEKIVRLRLLNIGCSCVCRK